MDLLKEKWEEILYLVKVEHELSDISFKTWLQPLQIHSVSDHTVTILVPSEQMGIDYITKKYMFPIKVAIAELIGREYEISFILPEQAKKLESKKKFSSVNLMDNSSNAEKANLNPKYTFDTFVVGNNNKFAHAAALAVAESPGKCTILCYPRRRWTRKDASDAFDRSFCPSAKSGKKSFIRYE